VTEPRLRVGVTADRRWEEQAKLLADRRVEVVHGPTLRTVDLSADEALRATTVDLAERPPDYLVVSTGMGLRRWLEAAGRWGIDGPLRAGLAATTRVVARGAKAHSASRAAGLAVWWRAPGETMGEIVDHLAATGVGDARVAVQLFEPDGHPSTELLRAISGELVELPVYQWALPDDPGPAERLIAAAVAGDLAAVTFTAQPAVRNLFTLADRTGMSEGLRAAFNDGGVVASCVGPVCASAATDAGIRSPLWPDPARLPAMVRQLVARLAAG
jgi:uroporphyrinogen-III synthase